MFAVVFWTVGVCGLHGSRHPGHNRESPSRGSGLCETFSPPFHWFCCSFCSNPDYHGELHPPVPLHLLFFWTKWWWFVMCWCSWRTRLKRVRRRRKGEIEWWETNELNLNSGWTKQEIVYELDACFFLSPKWDYDFWNMWYAGRYGSVHTNCSVMTFCMFWVASEYMGLVF